MELPRSGIVILHPTSLPSRHGIGDLGASAVRWLDFLAGAGIGMWQLLPLGPTGYGDSPYQCFSAFAGNPYLVSPEELVADDLLDSAFVDDGPDFPDDHVDYGPVIEWKLAVLDAAFDRFSGRPDHPLRDAFDHFCATTPWLDDYAVFMAIKAQHGGGPWLEWPLPLVTRDERSLGEFRRTHGVAVRRHQFRQFVFARQWQRVRQAAAQRSIAIIGDAPIFVAADSADVWAHPELFEVDGRGRSTVVAGVPPDYFSVTGQLWGNPLYDWEAHRADGYRWWIDRLATLLEAVDLIRIDHFRAFADYWEIPAAATTAVDGTWRDGPGLEFFTTVRAALGDLPIIAEDLGQLSPAVHELRKATGLPGMKILQFAFDVAEGTGAAYLPHNYEANSVAYTGTHDNNTTLGWWQAAADDERGAVVEYLELDEPGDDDVVWAMIDAVWRSRAALAGAPLQDFLVLGPGARLNTPGVASGNWQWRVLEDQLTDELAARMHDLTASSDRLPGA